MCNRGRSRDRAEATLHCPRHHAATDLCWRSTAPILCQPSILRNLICPLATRPKSRISAASSVGSEPCVFTRRRNSSWSRSIVFVVRNVFHCALGKRKNVRSSSAPSRKLVTTQIAARGSAYVVSLPRVPGAPNRGPWVSLRRVRRVAAQSAWRAARRAAGDRADPLLVRSESSRTFCVRVSPFGRTRRLSMCPRRLYLSLIASS